MTAPTPTCPKCNAEPCKKVRRKYSHEWQCGSVVLGETFYPTLICLVRSLTAERDAAVKLLKWLDDGDSLKEIVDWDDKRTAFLKGLSP